MNSPETIKAIITEYLLDSMKIKELPYPLNVSLDQYNVWSIVIDFENKTGINFNDNQIKRCKTVGNLIDMFFSVIILSSKAKIDNLSVNISSKHKYQSTNRSYSNNKGTSSDNNNTNGNKRTIFEELFDMSNMSIEELFHLVKEPLNSAKFNIKKLKTGESKFDAVRMSFLNSLTFAINEADEQENYLKQNLVQDHLVIAFFGETNAGKSTVIDTFRIVFDEETRRKAIEKANVKPQINRISGKKDPNPTIIGVDGIIVGDGRSDFTKTYDEYDMNIDGRKFTLIDVPGIEGNEAEYKDGIKKALQKAHCVFYVHGSDKKPNTKTTEKIKEYLNDWVGVYSIRNIRGGSEQYDEDDERETLLTDNVLRASKLSEEVFENVLGAYYKGNINIQGLLALCSKANFSPTRTDLIGIQSDLIEYFGNVESIYSFSHFEEVIDEVRKMSVEYKEIITKSNKDKVLALARKSISVINDCISLQKEAIKDLDNNLKTFERNVSSTTTKAEQRLNVKALVEREFDTMRYALYNAIDSGSEDKVKIVAKQQSKELERKLVPQIKNICSSTTDWYINEINRLKRDLDSTINLGNINISIGNISVGLDANKITDEMQDFDFGSAISGAMTAAGIAMLIPGVGWVLGSVIAAVGAFFGGFFGNDGRSDAKRKVDSTIDHISEKLLCQLNNGVLKKFKEQYKSVSKDLKQKISTERRNIQTLQSDIENLKEDIKITINQMKL